MTETDQQQIANAVESVYSQWGERKEKYLREVLAVVEGSFPEVVSDAQRLWEAIISDGLEEETYEPQNGTDELPQFFLFDFNNLDVYGPDADDPTVTIIKNSQNRETYRELFVKYLSNPDLDDFSKSTEPLGHLFQATFNLIKEL